MYLYLQQLGDYFGKNQCHSHSVANMHKNQDMFEKYDANSFIFRINLLILRNNPITYRKKWSYFRNICWENAF